MLRKGAGFAELDVTVISPLGQNLPLAVRSGDQPESDLIEFRPSAPGQYRFCIRYGGEEVPGNYINPLGQINFNLKLSISIMFPQKLGKCTKIILFFLCRLPSNICCGRGRLSNARNRQRVRSGYQQCQR